ncbi:MAG TPA: zinc ribbon domain-containing protein, partial [Ktedonobacteraceae bacterium]|nr:zinc ribbon domain-containing protein [Ktedonobacteraceae bacterium]
MQSTFCSQCNQPLPAGTAFCVNCGARQQPASLHTPSNPTPPPVPLAETVWAGASPSGAEYAPTQFSPPPPPAASLRSNPAAQEAYGSQHTPPPPAPPLPVYTPGPPPVVTPGGGVAPWAQAPKKRSGAKVALGCLVALILVAAVLGGGGFLLVKGLTSRGGATTHNGAGTGTTPAAGNTPGSGSTPGGSQAVIQTLNAINRQAIYAGVNITILSAQEGASLPGYQESDSTKNALEVQEKVSNQTTVSVYPIITALTSDGTTYELSGHFISWGPNFVESGSWFFDVPKTSKIGDFQIQFGSP